MDENKEIPGQDELSEEDVPLPGSYVLVYLKNQLKEVRNKKPIKGLTLDSASRIFDASFKEVNLDATFNIGNAVFVAEKHEYHDYLEIGFTKFPDAGTSDVISEGFRIRVKRGNSPCNNFIEYHRKSLDDKNSETLMNTNQSVSKAMNFIASIS